MCRTILIFVSVTFVLMEATSSAQTITYSNAQLTLIDNVKVASIAPGVVQSVHVSPGDLVTKGQTLAELDSDVFLAESVVNGVNLKIAKQESENDVDVRFAEKSAAVSAKLLAKSENAVQEFAASISETEIDRLRLEREQAVLSKEQAELQRTIAKLSVQLREAQLQIANVQLKQRTVVSPLAGTVVEADVQKGEAVAGGQTVVRIANLNRLRVKAVYKSEHALKVKVGQKATFIHAGKRIAAVVSFVSPEIRPSEQVFEVWADIDNLARELLPGFKGTLSIDLE